MYHPRLESNPRLLGYELGHVSKVTIIKRIIHECAEIPNLFRVLNMISHEISYYVQYEK